jgi:hypothetical protein
MNFKMIITGIALGATIPFIIGMKPAPKAKLFLPNQRGEWYTFLTQSKDKDPKKVFQFDGDVLHVSGEEFGYITTNKKYGDFHFTVEFKWGEKKYAPRLNAKRDAGIMYHVIFYNGDKIWPRSLEYQVQEGDCGDFWMTDSTTIRHHDTLTSPRNGFRVAKSSDAEKPNGEWNKAEVIVKDGKITHLLNGKMVNSGELGNTKEGTILLQSEGAEIYYRNAEVEVLD